jgi:hypothetical protein
MGMLGYIDDWALISAVYETIAADAGSTKKAARADKRARAAARRNGTPTEPTPGTDVVRRRAGDVEDEEPDADTARADARRPRARHPEPRRVRGLGLPHRWCSKDTWSSTLTSRERDRVASWTQALPPEIACEYAAGITAWRRFVTTPPPTT